ncbi:MAG TPA: hypothetical protein VK864_01425, partial [Longimicrobiales bacterium]|nr:hypothetical protein [Longimicrobiales bacterium]
PALSDYDGRATLEEFGAAPLVVRLADTVPGAAQGRLEIHYKLPAGATLIQLPAAAPLSLSYHETVEDGSQRRVVALAQDRAPLLVRVAAGDRRPYARAFPGLQLAVRQNAPAADGISTVTITHANRALTLRPGERQRSRDARGEVEIFLESSYWTPPAQIQLAEGDPYHVRLMVYRIAPTSPG